MNENLARLIRLQDLMTALAELSDKLSGVPAEVAALEKGLLAAETEVKREKEALGELQKERRRLESELMGVESRIQKYQAQLAEVKTNKEYQAMQHEIEGCKNERAALDEKILLDMEQQEKAMAAARGLDARLAERRRETDAGKAAINARVAVLKADQARIETERDVVQKAVPPAILDPFLKIAKSRRGIGLVAVREELCAGCHVRVMPKLIQEIRRSNGLIACNSCGRFLYVFEDAAASAASASAAAGASGTQNTPAS
ncbi:MAG TPA: C4-type zinc ribbon domain-containing protein [Candidatus Polarisedimenticolia bacterium]|nr:C4-type zinc ribbon domain-containing protein [Candidatus Polarisedimenticolia bacterium]